MKINRTGTVLGAVLLLGLTACGGGGTTSADSSTPAATSPAATDSLAAQTEEGCDVVDRSGSTSNAELQAFADAQFESLDCSSSTDLTEQLTALTTSAEFKKQVADQGWTADSTKAAGAVSVSITDLEPMSICRITVLDSPARGKSMDCQDV